MQVDARAEAQMRILLIVMAAGWLDAQEDRCEDMHGSRSG